MRYRIRATDDLDAIAVLDRECFASHEASPVELDTHDPECWLALAPDGELAGYAVAVVIDGVAYLRRAGVLPEHRGAKLQRRLIRARVRWAESMRCSRVETYTLASNHASMRSLIAEGFRPWDPPWAYVGSGPSIVYWHRRIA